MSLYGINLFGLDGRTCAPPGYYQCNISDNFEMYYYRRPELNREGIFVFSNYANDIDYVSLFAFHPNLFILMHYIRQTDTFQMYEPSIDDKIIFFHGNSEIYSDVVRRFFQELDIADTNHTITDTNHTHDNKKESKEDVSMSETVEFRGNQLHGPIEDVIKRLIDEMAAAKSQSAQNMYKSMYDNLLTVVYDKKSSIDYHKLINNLRFNITVIKKIVDDTVINESDDTEAKSKVSTIQFNNVGAFAGYLKNLIDLLYDTIKEV